MAEQFKKTYISVHEFVDSWEKEVYELTNLDYFIFLLINNLAGEIESQYLPGLSETDILQLHSEEIGTLTFNMGDALQQFLEENCFGVCTLNCPLNLKSHISPQEQNERLAVFSETPLIEISCKTKERCLYSEILNLVVVDSLLDFYHFDKGYLLDENDEGLIRLSDFIVRIILDTILKQGQKLLAKPAENATAQFDSLIKSDDADWQNVFNFAEEEEAEISEGEEWKLSVSGSAKSIENFKTNYLVNGSEESLSIILDRFSEFLTEFLEINHIDKLAIEEVQEFFSVIVVHELIAEKEGMLKKAAEMFRQLMRFLDFNFDLHLTKPFENYLVQVFPGIDRTFKIVQDYIQQHPLVNYLLSEDANDPTMIDGFFELINTTGQTVEVEDIHLKTRFKPIDMSKLLTTRLQKGDILHMQIVGRKLGFRLGHLEMVYPAPAKTYLY